MTFPQPRRTVRFLGGGCPQCRRSWVWIADTVSPADLRDIKRHVRWQTGGKEAETFGHCQAVKLPRAEFRKLDEAWVSEASNAN